MTTQTYQDAARHLLQQAETELAAGDTRQASEKGWGAAAQAVKAVADQRGLAHRRHAALFAVVDQLASETQDDNLRDLFQVASHLHTNFYEDWDTPNNVRSALNAVRRFVAKLEALQ